MPAQIVFLTLFLGIASGPEPLALEVSGPIAGVRVVFGGREVARLTQPPWRAVVDFGSDLTPRELTAIGLDAKGDEIARATQIINLPRPTAEFEIVTRGDDVTLHWQHLMNNKPDRATMTLDGNPLPLDASFHARLPKIDRQKPHVLSAQMHFEDGFVTRRELVIESVRSASAETQLTPVLLRETAPAHPKTFNGCLSRADGTPARVAAVEKPRALLIVVRDPDSREVATALQESLRLRQVWTSTALRNLVQLDRGTVGRILWPVARRFTGSEETSVLFEPSVDVDAAEKGMLFLLLAPYGGEAARDVPRQFADAVAVAGVRAVTGAQRRAVILVLGSNADASHHSPAAVRRYLESLGVPLFVWSVAGARPDLADTWGHVADVSNVSRVNAAVQEVRKVLDAQRVAWVEVDPLEALRLKADERCGIGTVARGAQ